MSDLARTVSIRPIKDDISAYEAVAEVVNSVWPDNRRNAVELQHEDHAYGDAKLFQRWVATLGETPVGQAKTTRVTWQEIPDKFWVEVDVLPAFEGRGIGRALYTTVLDYLAAYDPKCLLVYTREDKRRARTLLRRLGYTVGQREPVSRLDLARFDPGPFEKTVARAAANGIILRTLTAYRAVEPAWRERLHALVNAIRPDIPSSAPLRPLSLTQLLKRLEAPGFEPDLWFIAFDGNAPVGYSNLLSSAGEPYKLYTGATGVVRAYRRRGIATALKLAGIEAARARGVTEIETENEEHNPMLALNEALGFTPAPAWLGYELALDAK